MNYPLTFSPLTLSCRGRQTVFRRPLVMGILNATDDSFYDGGRYNTPDALLAHARQLLSEGADLLDLGVMSSRPGASMPTPQEETARLVPLVKLLRSELPDAILSVDTCRSLAAAGAVEAGADIINDISGGQLDPDMLPTAASLRVPYILMHMRGTPATMQLPENTRYNDIVDDLSRYFDEKLDTLHRLGAADVWLDPGLGFAKTVEHKTSFPKDRPPSYPTPSWAHSPSTPSHSWAEPPSSVSTPHAPHASPSSCCTAPINK